eukprot:CAMPEP_0197831458 /NCGR_PEP_ID=MMETSP1437-20131217/10200_1 /TAXON_ID=49252 ORGANISM="Eucampia antarctica, Strain CCMP1452" /NCGR_SAMPLE_ID=MMETSP1437 /ASSEMBLY_ACC=CAM_ASM_001096 /LENGTH=246 /DNA_ID=CAMNT_0043434379 /DNA_START=38 /DNA_END=775 /DNA_ORIENTATION=-
MASRASSAFLRRTITNNNIIAPSTTAHLFQTKLVIGSSSSSSQSCRCAHTVRVILTKDLPSGRGYSGEVQEVRAGYARNHLIPLKKALYATPQNFERVGIPDPNLVKDKTVVKVKRSDEEEEHNKAADLLRYYLRNKVLKIWRNADDMKSSRIHPGMVTHKSIREKLSKQLKIDLEDHEVVQLGSIPVVSHVDLEETGMENLLTSFPTLEDGEECPVQIKQLGEYVAKIGLGGGHSVGLKVAVSKR